jgi:hypothetical protein
LGRVLQTVDEGTARQALDDLETRYDKEKARLKDEQRRAKERAEPVRYGLLYGSGAELVRAVAAVLEAAGVQTIDLAMIDDCPRWLWPERRRQPSPPVRTR